MTLLAADIGNSHTVLGLVRDGEVLADWRVATDSRRTADEWAVLLHGMLGDGRDFEGISVCATVPAVRPSRATDCARVRPPGSTQDQKSRRPTPPATKTAVSSSMPCGRIRPQKWPPWWWRIMIDPITARFSMLLNSAITTGKPSTPSARQSAETQALLTQTWAAKCAAAYWL